MQMFQFLKLIRENIFKYLKCNKKVSFKAKEPIKVFEINANSLLCNSLLILAKLVIRSCTTLEQGCFETQASTSSDRVKRRDQGECKSYRERFSSQVSFSLLQLFWWKYARCRLHSPVVLWLSHQCNPIWLTVLEKTVHFSTILTRFRVPEPLFSHKFGLKINYYSLRERNKWFCFEFLLASLSNSSFTLMEHRIFDVVILRHMPLFVFSRFGLPNRFMFGNFISPRLNRLLDVDGASSHSNGFKLLLYPEVSSFIWSSDIPCPSIELSHSSRIISTWPLGLEITWNKKS